jgi:catechol 2,3-dioxygenase-like lactoylglutathione lyase family enzyme
VEIMQIQHLWLQTKKLEDLFDFYTRVLGLPLLEQTRSSFTVNIGASKLSFEQSESGETPVYHFAFNIPENQLLEAKAWTEARVSLIPDAQGRTLFRTDSWNAEQFYFYDPAGNILELIARHDLDNPSSQPFSVQSLENISELGVASLDPAQTAARLELPLYRCQANDTFMSVGDEQGLLILVRRGRIWFPETAKAAEFVPFRVKLDDGRTLTEADMA